MFDPSSVGLFVCRAPEVLFDPSLVGLLVCRAPEVLFDPSLVGLESKGIHHLVHDTINKCDIDVRRELYNNIVLSGGTSMFEGLQSRCVQLRSWQP